MSAELATDYLEELAGRPAARAPATFGEIWSAEWTRSGLDTIGGIRRPLTESVDELIGGIERASRTDLATYADRMNVPLGSAVTVDQRVRLLGDLVDTLPEDERKQLEPLRDVRRRASDKAHAIERSSADVAEATYGLSGTAVAFAAGIARQALDPVNLLAGIATAPIGGPFKGPALKFIGGQALGGALSQAAVEPYIQSARAELGLEAGFNEGALNVAQAAIGAAGIAGLFKAGAWGLRAARGLSGAEIPAGRTNAPALLENRTGDSPIASTLAPEDLEAAARVFERDRVIDRAAVTAELPTAEHAAAVESAARTIEQGAPVNVTMEPPPPKLVVAREMPDGTVRYGKPGELHHVLIDQAELEARPFIPPPTDAMGFAEPGGRFMSRAEALQFVARNEPKRMGLALQRQGLEAGKYQALPALEDLPLPEGVKAAAPGKRPALPASATRKPDTVSGQIGDPVLAREFERVVDEAGGDFELVLEDGTRRSVRELIEQVRADARAAAELEDCIGEVAAAA